MYVYSKEEIVNIKNKDEESKQQVWVKWNIIYNLKVNFLNTFQVQQDCTKRIHNAFYLYNL